MLFFGSVGQPSNYFQSIEMHLSHSRLCDMICERWATFPDISLLLSSSGL